MKKLIAAPIIVATLTASSFALAGGPDAMGQPAKNHGEVIAGADLGYSWSNAASNQLYYADTIPASTYTVFKETKGGFAFGAHVGYRYEVMPALRVGVEAGYLNFAKNKNNGRIAAGDSESYKYSVKDQVATLLATADYRLFDHYDVFAKFGPALAFQKSVVDYSDGVNDARDETKNQHGVKPFVSVGVGYNISNFEISVAYDRMFGKKATDRDVVDGGSTTTIKKGIFSQNAVLGSVSYALPL